MAVNQAFRHRIVIAGGGIAGLSLALALKRALGAGLSVVLADPALAAPPVRNDNRAYAVAAAARGDAGGARHLGGCCGAVLPR